MAAFFLGAGASISSQIPGAGDLARRWARELHDLETGDDTTFDDWRAKQCPEFDPANPARSYAAVMRRRFPTRAERQQEIERIVRGRDPGFAYATLAQLLAHDTVGTHCNIVVTTNFDDLVADALYLFTSMRPLVVTHEALVGYAAVGRTRPTVIKLHGDAMLEPRNTEDEVAVLAPEFVQALQSHLRSRALVIIGYGGNDRGVFKALSSLPPDTITHGIYWVNDTLPDTDFGRWLDSLAEAFWVKHLDFDELMAVAKDEFDLPHPDSRRFDELLQRYHDTFSDLQKRVRTQEDPQSAVARSVEEVRKRFGNWFSVELEAQKYTETDPAKAKAVYETGIGEFPTSAPLLGNYALFLDGRGDHDRAQELYERALAADPHHANNLGNFAWFLSNVREDHDRAQELYERAVAADPHHAGVLGHYARFQTTVRRDLDRAQELHERAVTAGPPHASLLGSYAWFLSNVREDHDRAQELYERAVAADPHKASVLGSYAWFLSNVREDHDRAQELYERAVAADPHHAVNLGNFALYLQQRGEHDRAQELYERAVAAEPGTNTLGNYGGLLFALGKDARAREIIAAARATDEFAEPHSAPLRLEVDFYQLANDDSLPDDERRRLLSSIKAALVAGKRSAGWDFDANISRARETGRPDDEVTFLTHLASVIGDEEPLESLDQFDDWANV